MCESPLSRSCHSPAAGHYQHNRSRLPPIKGRKVGVYGGKCGRGQEPDPLPYGAGEGLYASFASTLLGESNFTASPQPPRERKRRRIDKKGSQGVDGLPGAELHPMRISTTAVKAQTNNEAKRSKGSVMMREERITASGNTGPEQGTKGDPLAPRSRKRARI